MDVNSLLGLIYNIVLLLAMVLIFEVVSLRWQITRSVWGRIFAGLLLSGACVTIIATPWVFIPGVIFDTRTVLLGLAGLFFGAIPTLIAMAAAAAYRLVLGGAGVVSGVMMILASGGIGLLWRAARRPKLEAISWKELYLLGLAIHAVTLALMLALPPEYVQPVIRQLAPAVIGIYPVVTALVGTIIADRFNQEKLKQSLQENMTFTKTILDHLPVGIAVNEIVPAVNFHYMNDNFINFYHTSREALLSSPDAFWNAVYPEPQLREKIKQQVLLDYASSDPERWVWADIPIMRPGQETYYVTAQNLPIPGSNLMISTVWDVTQQKRAEQALRSSEAKFRALFESNHVIMMLIDPYTGAVIEANPAACAFYGWSQEEFKQKKMADINLLDSAEVLKLMQQATRKERDYFQFSHCLANGEVREVEVFSGPIEHNGQLILSSIIHDITQRKQIEQQLIDQLLELRRWHAALIGREQRTIELKREVNELLAELGKPRRYTQVQGPAACDETERQPG